MNSSSKEEEIDSEEAAFQVRTLEKVLTITIIELILDIKRSRKDYYHFLSRSLCLLVKNLSTGKTTETEEKKRSNLFNNLLPSP